VSRSLDGRSIAITGASSGIGAALARLAAASGACVAICARRADRLTAVATEIEQVGGRVVAIECDVSDRTSVDRFVARTVEAFGRLDVMVANAGIGYHGAFETTPRQAIDRLVAVNLTGTLHAAQAAMVVMRQQGAGHVIAVSSIVGRRGIAGSAVYSATKAAQIGFIEALRAECLGTGIHASVVIPVSTDTEFREAIARDFGHRTMGLGPKQSADVVASAILECIRSPRAEVYPYRRARLLAVINAVAPGLADRLVRRFRRRQVPHGQITP
jgi:short-subunit dehydrogenase